ncbi:cation transporter [Nibrella saemangeumensis]|uniref:Cation transporter n=1 Tax=Nibrella saemangeumensis TaxID=1084526 RepID=A0ABP8NER3_9BACT
MVELTEIVGGFLFCSLVIVLAGSRLSYYGDIIAEQTGLGGAWFGLILMAAVTSLPELITGLSSVIYVGAPELALGDVYGSCVFNMLILALMDLFIRDHIPAVTKVSVNHALAAALSIILVGTTGFSLLFQEHIPTLGWVSIGSLLSLAIYLMSVRMIQRHEANIKVEQTPADEVVSYPMSLKTAITRYSLFALLVVVSAIFLPSYAERLAEATGLQQGFVGTLFLATTTSLPEMVVSVSAIRIGAFDIAVGNLFGSNLFNIGILAIDDIAYTKGSIFTEASSIHIVSILATIIMASIAITGLIFRPQKKRFVLAYGSLLMVITYFFTMYLLYRSNLTP